LHWMTEVPIDTIRADPTRMAQGIMTGIGFLGAGVIFKEGLNVRGLTTAASIWITSAIGILIGIGFYMPALLSAVLTLAVLAVFRAIEARLPSEFYAHHTVTFERSNVMSEDALSAMIRSVGLSSNGMSSRLTESGKLFEYRMTLTSRNRHALESLSETLRSRPEVIEFRITPVD
jgi:putative Mg2+ transporter-C (MgtC) family protein